MYLPMKIEVYFLNSFNFYKIIDRAPDPTTSIMLRLSFTVERNGSCVLRERFLINGSLGGEFREAEEGGLVHLFVTH